MSTTDDSLQAGAEASEPLDHQGSDPATEPGENLDQTTGTPGDEGADSGAQPGDPAGFTKRIHQKHHELMEERRARILVEDELQKLQAQASPELRPVIPVTPDPYDEKFDELMATRDKAVSSAAEFDARKTAADTQAQTAQTQRVTEQQQALVKTVQTYADRAAKLSVNAQELQVAGQTVAAYGMSDQLTQFILADEQGPLITTYLAKNPEELDTLRDLDPMRAAVHIATTVRTKAVAAAPIPGVPPPADTLGGGGAPPSERGPKGATYE